MELHWRLAGSYWETNIKKAPLLSTHYKAATGLHFSSVKPFFRHWNVMILWWILQYKLLIISYESWGRLSKGGDRWVDFLRHSQPKNPSVKWSDGTFSNSTLIFMKCVRIIRIFFKRARRLSFMCGSVYFFCSCMTTCLPNKVFE